MIFPIRKYPDEILRTPTKAVDFPLSKEIKKLTKDMIDTVRKADGIGLAAPQLGKSVKVVVINLEKNNVPSFPLYNPRIVKKSFKKTALEEGCLSIPEVFGLVRRSKKITIEAQNDKGEKVRFTDDGWIARIIQHEIDHINGVLIIDHIKKYTQGEEKVKEWRKRRLDT